MTMICKICSHPKRLEIDRAIINSGNIAKIAKHFEVGYNSLFSHSKNHVSRQLATAWEKKETEESFDLLHKIDQIINRAEKIFKRNYDEKKDLLALKALDSQRQTIDLLARISYSLHQAKLAELEMMKQQSGEIQHEQQVQEITEGLDRLNEGEKALMFALQMKMLGQDQIVIPEFPTTPKKLLKALQDILPLNCFSNTDLEPIQFADDINTHIPNNTNYPFRRNKAPKTSKLGLFDESEDNFGLDDLKFRSIPSEEIPDNDLSWANNPINPSYHRRTEREIQNDMDHNESYQEMQRFKSNLHRKN